MTLLLVKLTFEWFFHLTAAVIDSSIIRKYLVSHFKHWIAYNTFIDFPHCVV